MRFLVRLVWLAGALLAALLLCQADVAVKGYYRKNGIYVAPYHRTAPNSTKNDNYSTKGNVNPYTGKPWTKPGDGSATSDVTSTGAPAAAASSTKASEQPAPPKEAPPPSPWVKIHVGMTKPEVTALLGTPNMQTAKKWVYRDNGSVTFDDKGLTDGVSAPK